MMFQDVVIVIPAYEPDDRLLELLKNIRDKENQMFDIILVDDGSGADFAPLFAIAQSNYACHLQKHAENKGKGRALCTDPKKLDNKLLKGFSSVLHRTESF